MTSQPALRAGSSRPGLIEALLAVVRQEFRAEVLVFAATDAVFGGGACRVGGCQRSARGHGLCQGHHLRWVHEDRPEVAVFAATTVHGGTANDRTPPAGSSAAATGSRAAACVSATPSSGTDPGAPTCLGGYSTRR